MKKILIKFLVVLTVCMFYYPSQVLSEGADSTLLLDSSYLNAAKINPLICLEIDSILARYNVFCPGTLCVECNTDLSVGYGFTEDGVIVILVTCGKSVIQKIECLNYAQMACSDSISKMEKTIAGYDCCPLPKNIITLKQKLAEEKYALERINFIMDYLNAKLKYIDILLSYLNH